ncbi:MAG: hypothetical protein R2848_17140 [Thermomicrobiales bacterium]
MRRSFRALGRLVAVLLAVLAIPVSGAVAQTPTSSTYMSEQFGYQVTWPGDWTYLVSESEPGGVRHGDARQERCDGLPSSFPGRAIRP